MTIRRADDQTRTLAIAASGAGAGTAVQIPGGEYMFIVNGTASGTTASLQFQAPDGIWGDIFVYSGSPVRSSVLPYTQTGIDLPAGSVRLLLSSGTPTNVNSYLVGAG